MQVKLHYVSEAARIPWTESLETFRFASVMQARLNFGRPFPNSLDASVVLPFSFRCAGETACSEDSENHNGTCKGKPL